MLQNDGKGDRYKALIINHYSALVITLTHIKKYKKFAENTLFLT